MKIDTAWSVLQGDGARVVGVSALTPTGRRVGYQVVLDAPIAGVWSIFHDVMDLMLARLEGQA